MLNKIALVRLYYLINYPREKDLYQAKVLSFELGQLGFKVDNIEVYTSTTREEFASVVATLQEMRGDDVKYVPLFTRFPDDLPNDGEYLLRRILGFFGINTFFDGTKFGANPISQMQQEELWKRATIAQANRLNDNHTEWIKLKLVSEEEAKQGLEKWALSLIYGLTPVKEALWEDIFTVLSNLNLTIDIEKISVKETLARVAAQQWQSLGKIVVKTPTDLLRMFAFIMGQDVSLAKPIDLKGLKLSKPQRREIMTFLSRCPALAEDLLRYERLWISLGRWLHPGDFVKQFPSVVKVFDDLRNGRIKSFEGLVINSPNPLEKLLERPSLLLRKLSWLLKNHPPELIAESLLGLKNKIDILPLPLLVTVYAAIEYDGERLAINKKGKSHTIDKRKPLPDVTPVLVALESLILTKLQGTKDWSKVWIDPQLDNLVLPLQVRKQSDGLLNLARGSRISCDSKVIRLFVYWQQNKEKTDLDLSVMRLDENFQYVGQVSWSGYGSGENIAHSGDIQSAPLGAAEFIDLRLTSLKDSYIVPSIILFTGEKFSELRACYAGWMKREAVGSDTVTFDAKTVAEKVNVNQDSPNWVPFILDVKAKEIIYVDLYFKGRNTIESFEHFPAMVEALASYWRAKPSFANLARWYVRANNAILVEDRFDAETTIGMTDDCTINVLTLVGQEVTSFSNIPVTKNQ